MDKQELVKWCFHYKRIGFNKNDILEIMTKNYNCDSISVYNAINYINTHHAIVSKRPIRNNNIDIYDQTRLHIILSSYKDSKEVIYELFS